MPASAASLARKAPAQAPSEPLSVAKPAARTSTSSPSPALFAVGPPALRLNAGNPLDKPMRHRMERSFGANLEAVRVHGDGNASAAADRMGATAFAFGSNIILGSGARSDDLGLIAHETAHTLQQSSGPVLQYFSPGSVDAHESEANRASAAVLRGERFPVVGRTAGAQVQRVDRPNIFQRGMRTMSEGAGAFLQWAGNRPFGVVSDVLDQIFAFTFNPFSIPGFLAGASWKAVPERFKSRVIDGLIRIVIRGVRAIPDNPILGPVWTLIKTGLIGFLEKALGFATAAKIKIADRVAKLLRGGSASFALGYMVGFVSGVWDGICEPFILIWDILKLTGDVINWLADAIVKLVDVPVEKWLSLAAEIKSTWETIKSNFWAAMKGFLTAARDPKKILSFIQDLWNSALRGARETGERAFDALVEFLNLGDYELGRKLGHAVGAIVLEVILIILSYGGYTLKPVVQRVVRWVSSFVGRIAKFVRSIGGPLRLIGKAIDAVASFAGENRAFQRVIQAVKNLLARLGDFLDEMYGLGSRQTLGAIPATQMHEIMEVTRRMGFSEERMLKYLKQLARRNPRGLRTVLSDLAQGGNKFHGAEWMLDYIDKKRLWKQVSRFEALAELGGRRWDAIIGGIRFQFKTWGAFYSRTFVTQILQDFEQAGLGNIRWAFKARQMGKDEIIRLATRALRNPRYGAPSDTAERIINELSVIIEVY